jgi:hypothetical protein
MEDEAMNKIEKPKLEQFADADQSIVDLLKLALSILEPQIQVTRDLSPVLEAAIDTLSEAAQTGKLAACEAACEKTNPQMDIVNQGWEAIRFERAKAQCILEKVMAAFAKSNEFKIPRRFAAFAND